MEIEPASVDQLKKAKDGSYVLVDNDVGNVAKDLQRIDKTLRLRYTESGKCWVVFQEWIKPDGSLKQHLVTTAQECDQRLVKRVERLRHADYAAELEKVDREADKAHDYKLAEATGEAGERLAHALRKDKGVKDRISGYNG